MAKIGNTVKLVAEFRDFDGKLADPDVVYLRVYDNLKNQIGATIEITEDFKTSLGVYKYPYVIPNGSGTITYEFTGLIEGNPCVGRGSVSRTW